MSCPLYETVLRFTEAAYNASVMPWNGLTDLTTLDKNVLRNELVWDNPNSIDIVRMYVICL